MKYLLAVVVLVGALLGEASDRAAALVGASTPGDALASGVVMVLDRTKVGAGFCSGVVVAHNAVLTAAHCLADPKNMRIHYRDATGAAILIEVAATAVHPLFRADAPKTRERSIDLALVRTANPLPERFRPVTLDSGTSLAVGARVRVAGFGVTREGAGDTAGTLRLGSLEVRAPISSILLWADDPGHAGTGACMGDSGGPVFAEKSDVVIAVTDWAAGTGRRHCGELTQAALIAPQRAWIDKILARWSVDPPT